MLLFADRFWKSEVGLLSELDTCTHFTIFRIIYMYIYLSIHLCLFFFIFFLCIYIYMYT